MIPLVGIVDLVTLGGVLAAGAGLLAGWSSGRFRRDFLLLTAGLLGLMTFRYVSNALEWLSITAALDPIEDFVEILEPLFWGAMLYAFLQGRSQQRLRASEQRYRALVDNVQLGITLIDADYRILMTNPAQAQMCGRSVEQLIGACCHEAFQDRGVPCERCPGRRAMETAAPAAEDVEVSRPDGTPGVLHIQAFPVHDGGLQVRGFIEVVEDVTERRRAAEALRENEQRHRRILDAMVDSVGVVDADGRIVEVNETLCRQYGYSREELVGMPAARLVHPDYHAVVQEFLAGLGMGADLHGETVDVRKDGSTFPAEVRGSPVRMFGRDCLLVVIRDVTERKQFEQQQRRLETQVQQTQKLESLGVLAGGIAHDFNNLLVAILGNADLALMDMSPVAPQRPIIEEIKKAARRAADLTNQMLAYSGKGQFVVRRLDLNELVTDMGHLLNVSISKKIILRYDLAEQLLPISADVNQVRQVVMNLITNASEAIGDRSGVVTVRTGVVHADRDYLAGTFLDEGLPEGYYVSLEVSDTGCGMDEQTRAHLFDPFFTTKFTGRGLGLAAVLGIVRGHGGAIKVYSEPGKGSTFRILLPVAEGAAGGTAEAPAAERPPQPGSGTLLVVDDEETVRSVAKMMLERMGYTVLLARDGQEAVETFRDRADEIDAVLLDMTMPRLSGEEAFRELRKIRSDVKVILSSGYNEQEATNRFAGKGLAGFIQKPFELSRLTRTVGEVLKA